MNDKLATYERRMAVWTPLIAVAITVLGGIVTFLVNARSERAQEDYVRREQHYAQLVASLRGFYVGGTLDAKARFLAELDQCWLYCSDEVIRSAYHFLDTVFDGADSPKVVKEAALNGLVLTIRKDLAVT